MWLEKVERFLTKIQPWTETKVALLSIIKYNRNMPEENLQPLDDSETTWAEQPHVVDLLNELRLIEGKETLGIVSFPSGRRQSVNDIIREVEEGTPEGRRLVELDQAVRARLARMEEEKQARGNVVQRTLRGLRRLFGVRR